MPINELTPVNEWPTRKLPQDRFDDAVKKAMDQMSVMVDELNSAFIPQTNESVKVINKISPNIDTILDAPNQAAAAAASAQSAASSETAAAQSASEAATSKNAAASSASSASVSKTAAAQSATEAAASASSASSSKTAAAQSASAASASEEAAASSASSASASKTAAAQSATEAAASASSASSSKTAAAQSAATASSEADRAEEEAVRAKNEADRAASVAAVEVASDTKAGIIKTDSKTLFVTDPYGTLTAEDVAIGGVLTDTARGRGQIGKCYSIPTSGVDFNTLTKAGRYWFTSKALANSTNKPPTNTGGFCDVLGDEGGQKYTKQIYYVFATPTVFIREHLGPTDGWSESWTKIITEKSIATTSEAGLVKPDGVTTEIGIDGALSVPKFTGSSAGLVPVATSADAKKVLLGNGTWGSAVGIATTKKAGIVKPQTGNNDGLALGGDGTLRVRQATDTQRGSVLVSKTPKAGAVPIAGTDGKIGNDWVSSMSSFFNSRVVITKSNAAWTPPVTGWARVIVIGGGGAGGGGSNERYGGLGGKQGGTTSFGDLHAIGGSGGGGASRRGCGGGGGGAGSVVHGFVYLNTGSPVSVTIGAGGAEQKDYTYNEKGTDGVGPQKGLAGTLYSGGCGAAGASAGAPLYHDTSGTNGSIYNGVGGSGGLNGSGYGGGGGGGGGDGGYRTAPGGAAGDGGAYGTVYGGAGGAGAIIVEYYDPEKETV